MPACAMCGDNEMQFQHLRGPGTAIEYREKKSRSLAWRSSGSVHTSTTTLEQCETGAPGHFFFFLQKPTHSVFIVTSDQLYLLLTSKISKITEKNGALTPLRSLVYRQELLSLFLYVLHTSVFNFV